MDLVWGALMYYKHGSDSINSQLHAVITCSTVGPLDLMSINHKNSLAVKMLYTTKQYCFLTTISLEKH